MTVKELSEKLSLEVCAGEGGLDREVSGCYIGDLLSLAMSRVQESNVWLTIQTNINIVAVSVLTEGACVVLCDGQTPDEAAAKKADFEEIPILSSEKTAYELACKLCALGV